MKIGFTTLGCPAWDLAAICEKGSEFGFDGVDFRGLEDDIDVTVLIEFTTHLAETKRRFADSGLAVSGISSSISICQEAKLEANIEEAKRTIPIALELGAGVIRVFGNGDVDANSRDDLASVARRTMSTMLDLDGARDLDWALETHDAWIASHDCKLLLDAVDRPEFGILWDMGHTLRVGGESPKETMNVLGDHVRYLHVKDAVQDSLHPDAMDDGWRYVPPGTGELPLAEAVSLLQERGYDGWLVLEHEKRWHAELPEPEEIFPQYVAWAKSLSGKRTGCG